MKNTADSPPLYKSAEDISVPMFESRFLDFFSRVHWSVPLMVYLPVLAVCGYWWVLGVSAWTLLTPLWAILLFLGGLLLWTLVEYAAHRWVFHYHPKTAWGKRLHFMLHGVHHDYPRDSWRLVLPPAFSFPLAVGFYYLFQWIGGELWSLPFFMGFLVGYLLYDMLHYATHHANWRWGWFRRLKAHHMEHHFSDPDKGYGVSTTLWDIIWGTLRG